MVSISIINSSIEINVIGFHKILAFKSKFQIKKQNIRNVRFAEPALRPPLFRMPGTHIPGLIIAGTFFGNGKREFWDRTNKNESIEIELKNEKYTRIVVDVSNPEEMIRKLRNA